MDKHKSCFQDRDTATIMFGFAILYLEREVAWNQP